MKQRKQFTFTVRQAYETETREVTIDAETVEDARLILFGTTERQPYEKGVASAILKDPA